MAPKLWRQSYGAKGMHAFIDYQRSGICYHQMSSACALLYICLQYDEVCICGHLGTPGFNVRTPLRTQKNTMLFIFRILIKRVIIRLLPYLTCKLT